MKVNGKYMRNKILALCGIDSSFAEDDKKLIARIWDDEGWDYSQGLYENLKKVSSPETIRRTRQKLAEEGKIKICEEVMDKRYDDFICVKEELGY